MGPKVQKTTQSYIHFCKLIINILSENDESLNVRTILCTNVTIFSVKKFDFYLTLLVSLKGSRKDTEQRRTK